MQILSKVVIKYAGEFTPGLSGGQCKLLAFEIIRQCVKPQSELLIELYELFARITDDFIPFILAQLGIGQNL
jgi:hypothetical protein